MKLLERIDMYLTEVFNIGDWVHQAHDKDELENTYALVVGKTKKGKTEVIAIQDFRPIPAKKTLDQWHPQPVRIDPKKVPNKLKAKVEKKKQQLGISESLSEAKGWKRDSNKYIRDLKNNNKDILSISWVANAFKGAKFDEQKSGYMWQVIDRKTHNVKHSSEPDFYKNEKLAMKAAERRFKTVLEATLAEAKSWLDAAEYVKKNHSMVYINPKTNDYTEDKKKGYTILDATTAGMLTMIHDALSGSSQKKFTSMNILQAVDIGWKLTK